MTTSRLAVIDLGSNTFHLLIVQMFADGSWSPLVKDRRYVKLASGGLDIIDNESIQRASSVLKEFAQQIKELKVDQTRAIGTAALREAKNRTEVVQLLEEESGIHIELIDGQREAEFILKGIRSVFPEMDAPCLIMDIGGGSVEFIIFQNQKLLFAESFKIGVALLYRQFHQNDPIHAADIAALEYHLKTELKSVINKLQELQEYFLIGASGSYEVIQDVLPKISSAAHWSELNYSTLDSYMTEVIHTNLSERRLRKEIPNERMDYIVVAYILIRFIIRSVPPTRLFYCDFALKEGVLTEMT